MTAPKFATHVEAQRAGWFSRRHETDEAHRAAREKYRSTHGKLARRVRAEARAKDAA